jgi:hypothetical protein
MNWSKGFFRLWFALSVLWIVANSFWLVPVANNYFDARSGLQSMEASRIPYREDKSKILTAETAESVRRAIKSLEMIAARGNELTEREKAAIAKGKKAIEWHRMQLLAKARARRATAEDLAASVEVQKLRQKFQEAASIVFLPIFCTLLFGFLVRWILRGFSR